MSNLECIHRFTVFDSSSGETICRDCGIVISEKTQLADDYYSTSSLCHPLDTGLSTLVGRSNFDVLGRRFSYDVKNQLRRLRMLDRQAGSSNAGIKNAFAFLNTSASRLSLPNAIVSEVAYLYRKARLMHLIHGRNMRVFVAALVYAACRKYGVSRTIKEITSSLNLNKKQVSRCYKIIVAKMDLKIPIVDPISYLPKIASSIQAPESVNRHAIRILQLVENAEFSAGKDPMSLAGAALYVACLLDDLHYPQTQIAKYSLSTPVTIRNLAKGIYAHIT